MSYTTTTTTTIDAAGRVVLPKAIRERAQLVPGAPIEVRLVDGRVELEPASAQVSIERRGDLWVAVPASEVPVLTAADVETAREVLIVERASNG
jgi:AbrB family looped-hinge helix DNA binding protein